MTIKEADHNYCRLEQVVFDLMGAGDDCERVSSRLNKTLIALKNSKEDDATKAMRYERAIDVLKDFDLQTAISKRYFRVAAAIGASIIGKLGGTYTDRSR